MNTSDERLKEDYEVRFEYLKHLVNLMNDIFLAAWGKYGTGKMRMYPHRQLCMGTLIVARHNTEATIHLIEKKLIHQVHYISRSMLELTINLYYILDDKSERDARLERYMLYSDEVLPRKALMAKRKYPDAFKGGISEQQGEVKEKRYRDFLERYSNSSTPNVNTQSWSGMTMDKMIVGILNKETRKELQTLYDLIIKSNNFYLHPSWYYLKNAVVGTTKADRDYQESIAMMTMLFMAAEKVVSKFLENFPKGRIAFVARMRDISKWFRGQ